MDGELSWASFNYAPLAFLVVIGYATLTWWLSARHWFTGPKVQGSASELEAAERDLQALGQPAGQVARR